MPRPHAGPAAPTLPCCLLFLLVVQHAQLMLPACAQFPATGAAHPFTPPPLAAPQQAGTAYATPLNATLKTRVAAAEEAEERLAALFQHLVSQSNATEYYLLYDASLPGLAGTITAIRGRWRGMTLFRCSSSSSSLEWWLTGIHGALTKGYDPATHRNVLVACTASRTAEIFHKASQAGLVSPSVHWYVALEEEGAAVGALASLREGMQVTVAERANGGLYHLLASYVDTSGEIALEEVGWWLWLGGGRAIGGRGKTERRGGDSEARESAGGPPILTRYVKDQYRDMRGRQLRSCVVENSPYFRIKTSADGSLYPGEGIDVNLLNILAAKMNFTYRLVEATDGQWGEVLPGAVTGMIGVVARREADMAVNEITITGKRETVVDFSMPYYVEGTVLMSPAPEEKNRAFAAFSPFSGLVWGMVTAVTLAMGFVLAAVVWVREQYVGRGRMARLTLNTLSFTVFRSLVVQGNLLFPKETPLRIIFLFWYMFCFIIYALYSGTLTAVLALPTFTKPIETLTDLLVAARQGRLHPAVVKGTSNAFLLKEAEDGIYKDVWDVFEPALGYAKNYDAGADKVMTGPFVFINARLGSEVRAAARGIQKFYISRDSFYPQSYGIAFQSGSPIRVVISPMLTSITASGLVGKWMRDEVRKVTKSVEVEKNYAITLVHLQAAFFILLFGFLIAASALLLEKASHRCGFNKGEVRVTEGVTVHQNGHVSAS
ncbi:glutamate receptor ionotropic, delta-1-like [Eriocheir sinensis]|uniref:glutamate receptor ionotropic, delta-1-like n=1 Tax=Eriocheir sinensis TaxID=95602 RepID=UPI0021C77EAE|nr:glutamate receptor ionotropic, delta-1-like [Eriocheir sinensis]